MHDLNDFPAQALPDGLRHARHIEAALSGGLDSVVLLHLLSRLAGRLNIKLTAVHVHHGLQDEADGWLEFCRDYCDRLTVPLRWQKVNVVSDGLGIEAAARQARYRVFGETEADVLAAAHHADDQVETFMLAALRGGGLRALSAMPAVRPLNRRTLLWRPLLPYGRAELEAYAERHKLAFVCDPSNGSSDYLRNWLRNDGLPQWRARLPQLDQHILSGIGLLQDELAVLEETAAADEAAVQSGGLFDAARWRTLPPARRRQVLRRLLAGHGVSAGKAALHDFERILMNLGQGGAEWKFPQQTVYAAAGRLYFLSPDWQAQCRAAPQTGRLKELGGGWQLRRAAYGLPDAALEQTVRIRTAESGDLLHTSGGRKKPKQILQEAGVPPFARPLWPIVADAENRCLAVAGIRADSRMAVADGLLPCWGPLMRFVPPR